MPRKSQTHKPYQVPDVPHDRSGRYNKLYQDLRWERIRRNQLNIEPLCRMCLHDGLTTPATICDHIEPHHGDTIKFLKGPFQSLCKLCHDSKKQAFEKSGKVIKKIGLDGYPVGEKQSEIVKVSFIKSENVFEYKNGILKTGYDNQ